MPESTTTASAFVAAASAFTLTLLSLAFATGTAAPRVLDATGNDRKLGLFFDPAEIETLKSMARTGSFEVFQPRGSMAVPSSCLRGRCLPLSTSRACSRPPGEVAAVAPTPTCTAAATARCHGAMSFIR